MSQSAKPSRSGFTILELLLVIGIIGILFALFMPFVRTTREAARRTSCMNNIRQLALGVLNYESAHQQLPPATGICREAQPNLPPTTDQYSGFLSIFTFIERYSGQYFDEEMEHDGVNYPAYPDVNTAGYPLWSNQSYTFLCPTVSQQASDFAAIHYAFSIGDVARNVHFPTAIRGAFAVGRTQTLEEITDGTSNTIGLVEIGGTHDRSPGRRFAVNQPNLYLENPSRVTDLIDHSNRYLPSVELSQTRRGGNWADGTGGPGLVNTILPPGSPTLLVGGQREVDGLFSASENHPGGTVVSLCDGSTQFIDVEIDVGNQGHPTGTAEQLFGKASHYGIWGALGSASGSESVDSGDW